tara:strand:- start:5373 stop:5804 length:432 start_codon:yes stop_codon:yes gene_type:complete
MELLNELGVNTYECKSGYENRFHDMAKIIKSMNTRLLTGSDPETTEANSDKAEGLVYDAQTHLYEAMELLEKLNDLTLNEKELNEANISEMTQSDRQMAREIMSEFGGEREQRVQNMIESLNGCFGLSFTEQHLTQLGLGVTI